MNKIIAFAGQAGNGKDVAADYLCKRLNDEGGRWKRKAIAHNVKKIFKETFGVNDEFIDKWKRVNEIPEGFGMNVRTALTFIGDGFRRIQSDIWLRSVLAEDSDMIVSDCRYVNEAMFFRNKKSVNILMWREGFENEIPNASEQELMPFVNMMKSEEDGRINADIPFDLWIRNNGNLDNLYQKIEDIIIPYINNIWDRDENIIFRL
jgi:hypothetical protein